MHGGVTSHPNHNMVITLRKNWQSEVDGVFVSLAEISHQLGGELVVAAGELIKTLGIPLDIESGIELAFGQNPPARQVLTIVFRAMPEVGNEAGHVADFRLQLFGALAPQAQRLLERR